jgi:predicted O-methyltransferase YrrM
LKNPDSPWLTAHSVELLSMLLNKELDVGIEFGSGRSTLWFSKKLKHLISIEDNLTWYKKINRKINEQNINNIEYKFIDSKIYAAQALNYPDNYFGFCLVDGPDRALCTLNVLKKIKLGGVLVIDNVNLYLPSSHSKSPDIRSDCANEKWLEIFQSLNKFRCIWTTNGVSDTLVAIRIS